MRSIHTRLLTLVVALLPLPLLMGGCSTNAATGKLQFNTMSRSQEVALGSQAMPGLIEGYGGEVQDERLRNYVSAIGMEVAQGVEEEYRDIPWEFTLLDSEVINAFALPGGKVFISRGLMERMTNESQLAGVLGHEIGHVTAEHADQQVSRQMVIQGIAVGAAMAASTQEDASWTSYGVPVLVGGAGLFNLKFGRDEESQADALGMRYMTRAGYNPRGMLGLMEILQEASGGGGGQPEFLSTHPLPQTRIDRIKQKLKNQYKAETADPSFITGELRFQQEILPMLRAYSHAQPAREFTQGELVLLASTERGCWCPACCGGGSD